MTDSGGYLSHHSSVRHSHSTPFPSGGSSVGVIGSDSARTPPATPKKGGKILAVRVQMLDDSVTMFQVQAKALGRLLFDQVCRQLNLLEADYFGLEYTDPSTGARYWLDLEKPLGRQVGLSLCDALLRFCTKFYTPDPAHLEEEFTRYLLCLQVKRDLAHGLLQCNDNTAALMASYIVQSECGDYVVEDYPDHTYLSSYKFVPHQDAELERRIMENHKKHAGQSPAEADLNLLETARRCELYGVKMHPAKDHEGVPLNLAVAHMGIVVFQNCTKINTFSWAKIRKISFKRKRFLIKLHPEGYGLYKDTVEFFFEGRNECKNFWKKCVEHHGFFRCSSVKTMPRHKARVISRGSSFRYSGRTQKQIVEFVRENYLKRQTFQRSQSFRHSRCVHSSVASVGTSISAHPLLPLGDNAVAGTPASLSCGSMTLDDPGSPGGCYPGSAPCTSPAHTMEHHLHHHTHHSHQGLAGIGRPSSRQDTLSPATSVASSPSPPPAGQKSNEITETNMNTKPVNGVKMSESCSNLPSRVSNSQSNDSLAKPQYSSSYPEHGVTSADNISHDSYELLASHSDEEDHPVEVYKSHRIVGRTRSDPACPDRKLYENNQLRMAKSEPSQTREDRSTELFRFHENQNADQFAQFSDDSDFAQFNDKQEVNEPLYENRMMDKRFIKSEPRFCSHCRGEFEPPIIISKFSSARSEPMLCPGTSRMYSDDDSSDQYVDAQVERIPSDDDEDDDRDVDDNQSCSSPEIFEMEKTPRSPRQYTLDSKESNRYVENRLPSPQAGTVFYFPAPSDSIKSPQNKGDRFFVDDLIVTHPYSPRQSHIQESSQRSPQDREVKFSSQESRPLKSPPPPSHPSSPRLMLSPRQLLSPRNETSPRSPTRKFFPEGRIKSPTSPRQSLFQAQDPDTSSLLSPPVLSPKILTHQTSIDIQDECDIKTSHLDDITDNTVPNNDLDYILHKRHFAQSDSGSGSESSSDHRSRRAAPRRRALNNHGGQTGSRIPVPLFAKGSLEQRRQQKNARAGGAKPLDVVALHRLPPTNAFSSTDDTVEKENQSPTNRTEIHSLKMAFLMSNLEEEPKTIDSSRVLITDIQEQEDLACYENHSDNIYENIDYLESHQILAIASEDEEKENTEDQKTTPTAEVPRRASLTKQASYEEVDDEMPEPDITPNEEVPRRPSLSRMKSMSEDSDDTETARTVVTPRHTAQRKTSLCRTASISEDSDACLGSDSGRKNKMASDESDFEGKLPEINVDHVDEDENVTANGVGAAAAELSQVLEERRRALKASSEDDSDHPAAPSPGADSHATLAPKLEKPPSLSDDSRQDSVSELEKALIRALMRNSSTDDEGLSRQTSIDKVIMETTDPSELEKILIRAIMRSTSTEENPSHQGSTERPGTERCQTEITDPSELEKALICALMRNSSTEDDQSSTGSRQVSIDSSRITVETFPLSVSPSLKDEGFNIDDPAELEKALIRALMRNSSTDDEAMSRQASIDSSRVNVATQENSVQQALDLEKVLLRAIMKSSSEDEPPKTVVQQNELEDFLLQSLVKSSSEEDLVFTSDKRRASCPMTKLEKSAAEFDGKVEVKPRRASEGSRNQTVEFHHEDFSPHGAARESIYHSTHDLTRKQPKPLAALELFESRRDMPLRRSSYPPSSSEDDESVVKPRQTRSSYVPSSSEDEDFNRRVGVSKSALSDHALSRRSHIEGMRRAMLDSSGSSSLEDDNPVFLPSDATHGVGSSVLLEYAVGAVFAPARTLSRISERSTTSEQERTSEEESKMSSPSSDSEATNSEISSGAGRGENSLSSDPSSSERPRHHAEKANYTDPSKRPKIPLPDSVPDELRAVTASTYIAPCASSASYLDTLYLEVRPEQASPVTLPLDSSSTDDNQYTLQDSPSSSSSRYDYTADHSSHPDFFTPITCTPPSSPPITPIKLHVHDFSSPLPSPPPIQDPLFSPDVPLPPPPPESNLPCSLDDPDWGGDLPPPPPDFTSVSPNLEEMMKQHEAFNDVIIVPPDIRRRPFTDPSYDSGSYTLPRRQRPDGHGSSDVSSVTVAHTLPRRHIKKSSMEVSSSTKSRAAGPSSTSATSVRTSVSGHHTFPRQRKHRSSHSKEQQSSHTLPRVRHRTMTSRRVTSMDRPCVIPSPKKASNTTDV